MKPATAKTKGRETENSWIEFLRPRGLPAVERRRLMGALDQGDVSGWPNVCSEVKSGAKLDILNWLRQLDSEIVNSKSETGYVVVRPKGLPDPKDWYVVMRTEAFIDLMKKAKYID